MLCDELWMMCVQKHQQDLLLEAARHALQRSARAQRPRRLSWWRALSHTLHSYKVRLHAFWWRRQLRQTDASTGPWEPEEKLTPCQNVPRDLAVAAVRAVRVP